MAKFASDRRKQFGSFEAVDFVDETEVAALRSRLTVHNPTHIRWNNWEYGSEIAELRRLYEKGKRAQWNAAEDIDWSLRVSKDEWIGDPTASILASICKVMGYDEATQ